jgi:putative hemolysin
LDDPLSTHSFLLQVQTGTGPVLVDCLLILFFFISATLLSAMERSARALTEDELDLIGSKFGRKFLARCLRDSRRMHATFLMGKYISLISITLFCYFLLLRIIPGEGNYLLLVSAALLSISFFFFSFLSSRLLVANSDRLLLIRLAPFVLLAHFVFIPFSSLYMLTAKFFDAQTETQHANLSMDELSRALDLTKNEQTNSEEHKLLKGIVTFGNMDITRIMKPKMDIVAFEINTSFRKILSNILDSGYSRIPVYTNNLDNISGVLYIKDLLPYLDEDDAFNWASLLRPCFFIPENKKPDDLLREFQNKKTHLAIVVDEFGQTTGLVTLEDIIEEIVGDIKDEFDEEEVAYSRLDDQNYVFEGKTSMNDFLRIIGRSEESITDLQSDADTLSGFIIERAGRFPKKNEKLNWENFTFNIESADSRRIKRVKVTIRKKTSLV